MTKPGFPSDSSNKASQSAAPPEPFSKEHPDRTERTLLGLGIGAVRDSIWGAPQNDTDRKQRSASNDDYAHLAADVISSVPHIRALGAAVFRGVLLHDLNATSAAGNLGKDMLNAAGGIGLNAITKSSMFGTIHQTAFRNFGNGVGGELANQAITGTMFGATRTWFDAREWHVENDKLVTPSFKTLLQNGLVTGVLGAPAGVVGSRVAGMLNRTDSAWSRISSGVASGSASGGLFGATDAFVHTGSLSEAGSGFLYGMATGAIAGGGIAGAERIRQDLAARTFEKHRSPPSAEFLNDPVIQRESTAAHIEQAMALHGERLSFKPDTRPLSELTNKLPQPSNASYNEEVLNPFGPANFWNRAQFKWNLYRQERPALAYEIGNTKLIVPADYAAQLQEVRQLRLSAELGNADASKALETHPLRNRILPEEMLADVEKSADPTKIRRLHMLGNNSAWDPYFNTFDNWSRATEAGRGPRAILADARKHGFEVRFYQPKNDGVRGNREIVDHESTHLNHDRDYYHAQRLDKKIEVTRYGYANLLESEAEMESVGFLGSTRTFLAAADEAPVRMTLLARKLDDIVGRKTVSEGIKSTAADTILERIKYVDQYVRPKANESIINQTFDASGKISSSWYIPENVELLGRLNPTPTPEVVASLEAIARSQSAGFAAPAARRILDQYNAAKPDGGS